MDISIIIPVYNAEKYLERCLKSVLASFEMAEGVSGEVLVVDNGSTDSSLKIAKKYATTAPKGMIRVLQCHTPGASAVRNWGAEQAEGTYIWFVDADDEIAESAIEDLWITSKRGKSSTRTRANLVMMGAERIYPDGHQDYLSAVTKADKDYISRFIRYGMGPWQVMIRRKWWNEYGFKFKEGIIHEDMELMPALILFVKKKFDGVDKPLYFYHQNEGSVLHKSKFDPHIFDIFPALEGLYERFKEAGMEQKYHDELEWFFIWNLLIDSNKDFRAFPEGKPGLERSRQMLSKFFPAWRKNRFLREKPLKLRIRILFSFFVFF